MKSVGQLFELYCIAALAAEMHAGLLNPTFDLLSHSVVTFSLKGESENKWLGLFLLLCVTLVVLLGVLLFLLYWD